MTQVGSIELREYLEEGGGRARVRERCEDRTAVERLEAAALQRGGHGARKAGAARSWQSHRNGFFLGASGRHMALWTP